jgi:hypothetical protein
MRPVTALLLIHVQSVKKKKYLIGSSSLGNYLFHITRRKQKFSNKDFTYRYASYILLQISVFYLKDDKM